MGALGEGRDATPEFPPHKHIYPFFSLSLPREEEDDNDYIFLVLLYLPSSCSLGLPPPAAAEAGKGNWLNALSVLLVRVRIFSVRGTDKDASGDGRTGDVAKKEREINCRPGEA